MGFLKRLEEIICRNSPTKKREKKCKFLKSLGRGYLSEQSHQKKEKKCQFLKSLGRGYLSEQSHQKKVEKLSILEKFRKRLFVGTVPQKREKKCKFLKSLEIICRNSPTKKKEKKCQFWKSLGRGYLSEQSQQKKGEKVSILEKFRDYLFVGTVPQKKGRKNVNS